MYYVLKGNCYLFDLRDAGDGTMIPLFFEGIANAMPFEDEQEAEKIAKKHNATVVILNEITD